jgi:apolipoprotein N-acyltransferase
MSLLLALASGAAAGLAHPPFGVLPGLLGFGLLLHLLDHAQGWKAAFARGWAAGFAYFLVGTWWVGEAFMVDPVAHGWQAPFAVTLLPAGLALFWGLAGAHYRKLAPKELGARRVLVFAAVFGAFEWIRGHVLTGFPWDLPGEAWRAGSAPSQAAAYIGAYGLSFLTLAIAATPGLGRRPGPLIAAAAALAVLWGGGAWRLAQAQTADTDIVVRIVQPDIKQAMKWTPAEFTAIVQRYLVLTRQSAPRTPDVVVWPEAAIPAPVDDLLDPRLWMRRAIEDALKPGQTLLMGAYREEGPRPLYYNSLYALRRDDKGLTVTGRYDKFRLVPFGEYLPMEGLLTRLGLKALVAVGESFSPGPEPTPISPAGLPRLQPLICYESLYPALASDGGARPDWIVNVSNDAWFGQTSGPWQHLNLASYRAIEAGLPMIRATPTGVSGVIDGYGRLRRQLPVGRAGIIDAPLPKPQVEPPYSRLGDLPFFFLILLGFLCSIGRRASSRT